MDFLQLDSYLKESFNDLTNNIFNFITVEAVKELDRIAPGEFIGFKWKQYVPAFNDGDACRFTIYDLKLIKEYTEKYEEDYDEEYQIKIDDIVYETIESINYAWDREENKKVFKTVKDEKLYDLMRIIYNNLELISSFLEEKYDSGVTIILLKDRIIIESNEW